MSRLNAFIMAISLMVVFLSMFASLVFGIVFFVENREPYLPPNESLAMGYKSGSQITTAQCQILIGENVQSDKDYEFVLKVGDYEIRTIMTPAEQDLMKRVITRAIHETADKKGYPKNYIETGSKGEVIHGERGDVIWHGVNSFRASPNAHIGPTEESTKKFQKSLDNRALGYHENLDLSIPKGYMELGTPNIAIHSKHEPIVTQSNGEWIINFKDGK